MPRPTWRDDARADWRTRAACRDMPFEDFFPPRQGTVAGGLAVCIERCPVRDACLDFALSRPSQGEAGVWGGTSTRDRWDVRVGRITPAHAMARGEAALRRAREVESLAPLHQQDQDDLERRAAHIDRVLQAAKESAMRAHETLIGMDELVDTGKMMIYPDADRGALQACIEEALTEVASLVPDGLSEGYLPTTAWIVTLAVNDLLRRGG